MKHRFKNLQVWKNSMELVQMIYQLTDGFPESEKFGLVSQMRRCSISIPSNIAEGSARSTDKDFGNFIRIANGSAFELETQLILSKELGFINEEQFIQIEQKVQSIQKMLIAFHSKLILT